MNIDLQGLLMKRIICIVQHYNHEKYWKMRAEVVNPSSKKSKITRLFYLYRIKRMDAFHNASMGTDLGGGAEFASHPTLMHGLNGIIVRHSDKIGKNVTICQQVTIAQRQKGTWVEVGDNAYLGAGCKLTPDVKIGANCIVGANAVVTHDMPANTVVAGVPARVIKTISKKD